MNLSPFLPTAFLLALALVLPSPVLATPPPASASIVAVASHCAVSIEQAARGIFGDLGTVADAGYRIQDLVVDPILRKAWVRVADCHDPRKPLTLVPLAANLASPAGPSSSAASTATSALSPNTAPAESHSHPQPVATTAPILIARGDLVEVLVQSSNVRMTLEGHATTSAAATESLDVVLDNPGTAAAGDPPVAPRHLRGVATAAHRVEVSR